MKNEASKVEQTSNREGDSPPGQGGGAGGVPHWLIERARHSKVGQGPVSCRRLWCPTKRREYQASAES